METIVIWWLVTIGVSSSQIEDNPPTNEYKNHQTSHIQLCSFLLFNHIVTTSNIQSIRFVTGKDFHFLKNVNEKSGTVKQLWRCHLSCQIQQISHRFRLKKRKIICLFTIEYKRAIVSEKVLDNTVAQCNCCFKMSARI